MLRLPMHLCAAHSDDVSRNIAPPSHRRGSSPANCGAWHRRVPFFAVQPAFGAGHLYFSRVPGSRSRRPARTPDRPWRRALGREQRGARARRDPQGHPLFRTITLPCRLGGAHCVTEARGAAKRYSDVLGDRKRLLRRVHWNGRYPKARSRLQAGSPEDACCFIRWSLARLDRDDLLHLAVAEGCFQALQRHGLA
jgi:hypothetical protein